VATLDDVQGNAIKVESGATGHVGMLAQNKSNLAPLISL